MIYIIEKSSDGVNFIHSVWKINCDDVETAYKEFLLKSSGEMNIVVNPHWFNVMDYMVHNSHLTEKEYKVLTKKWKKFLCAWCIDKFVEKKLKGIRINYKILNF